MTCCKPRIVLSAMGATIALLSLPGESRAFFGLFDCNRCSRPAATTTYYAPVVAAAPAPQVCNYVPQTCYRTVYATVPVTSYRPVTTADPCTGCATTTLRPITAYVAQPRLVPYTTYRPVYSNSCGYSPCATAPTGCGGTCGQVGMMSPMTPMASFAPAGVTMSAPSMLTAPSSGCSSCGTPSYVPAPMAPLGAPGSGVPSLSPGFAPGQIVSPNPGAMLGPNSGTIVSPSAPAGPATLGSGASQPSSPPSTFKESPSAEPDSRLKPIPDSSFDSKKTNLVAPPRELNFEDRTTARPIQRASLVTPVSTAGDSEVLDDSGWHSAR